MDISEVKNIGWVFNWWVGNIKKIYTRALPRGFINQYHVIVEIVNSTIPINWDSKNEGDIIGDLGFGSEW